MFPVEAHITVLEPSSMALTMAMAMPRSLKLPVGFAPSNLKKRRSPPSSSEGRFLASIRGVFPSFNDMSGVLPVTGR